MATAANGALNPMSEYLLKIQLIVNQTEFKNKTEASSYETVETKLAGAAYVRAVLKTDIFESYTYDPRVLYTALAAYGYDENKIFYLIDHPQMIPQTIKNKLLDEKRSFLIANYVERNQYYVRLTGTPYPGDSDTPPEKVLLLPDEFYWIYADDNVLQRNQPIHEMPAKYQELFMNSEYYDQMIKDNPDSKYLMYIGSNSIPVAISRPAQDGDILRINTSKLSTYHPIFGNVSVSPEVIHQFVESYKETRDYVFYTLRGDFGSIYPNYDSFIRFLTIYLAIGNTLNEFMHKTSSMIYMNNVAANNFFMLYGLPSVIMEGASMIDFLKKFRMILMDKGTNVVYRVKDLIGYEYTDIYTLVMVKQQVFDKGVPLYQDGKPVQNIVFRRLGTTDDNTSYFNFRNNKKSYTVDEITGGDPRWWNTPEVEAMLQDMNYTLSNSKYIQLSTHLSMTDIWWQCTILLRGLLDQRQETQYTLLNVNYNINGSSQITIFEAVLVLTILMNYHLNQLRGDMYLPNGTYNGKAACVDMLFNGLTDDEIQAPNPLIPGTPYKLTSFNFHIREEDYNFYQHLNEMAYIDPSTFIPMLDNILDRTSNNVGDVLMEDVKLLYQYLAKKLQLTRTIEEFRQVTDVFEHLFLVDPVRNWYDSTTFDVDNVLLEEYGITMAELSSLKSFFKEGQDDITITFDSVDYPISLYQVLNSNAYDIMILDVYPFRDNAFVEAFAEAMKTYSNELMNISHLSPSIKDNYQSIIGDKVILDVSNTADGPKSFDALLFRNNPSLYRYVMSIKSNGNNMLMLMRAIVKALENYTNASLHGLEFKVIGKDEYFRILKEVISYFKSYMVEYTKDEFVYIMDGFFDHGGHSNMLRMYDKIAHAAFNIIPKDSLTLYDVSRATVHANMQDDNIGLIRDELLVRLEATYQTILNSGYEIWYDDGKRITQTPFQIENDTRIVVNFVPSGNTYKIIINKNNLDNYVGNTR